MRLGSRHRRPIGESSDEVLVREPVDRRAIADRRLPGGLGRRDLRLAPLDLPLQVRQPALKRVELFLLVAGRRLDERRRVAELDRPAVLGDVVEEGEEPVEVLLRDRVELVVVAAGAAEGQAQPDGRRGVDAIDDVLDGVLLGDDAALGVAAMVAVEAGRDLLVERWRRAAGRRRAARS